MKEEEWNDVINLNLSTTFFLTKEIIFLPFPKYGILYLKVDRLEKSIFGYELSIFL